MFGFSIPGFCPSLSCSIIMASRPADTKIMTKDSTEQDLYSGLVRLHILHHAAKEPFYGLWLIEELRRHGYALSPGTLYPMLHRLERQGYLRSRRVREGKRIRRLYQATARGRRALGTARERVHELFGELLGD